MGFYCIFYNHFIFLLMVLLWFCFSCGSVSTVSAWFFGDPHIHTLDNFEYTFNGLGEYTLIETNGGNFTLQGRTAKAINENGTETNATVFSAFAAKDTDSDRVYIAMNRQRDGT